MKRRCIKIALTAASLLMAVNIAFAVDVKVATPDVKGATRDAAKAAAKAKVVDINTASEAELKAIPGIGDVYAAKIIAGRPYTKKDQLKSRNILPAPVYEKTKDLIIAKQAAKKK